MKITLESEYYKATIEEMPAMDTIEQGTEAQRLVQLVRGAMLALGYAEKTVNETFPEE